MDGEIDSSDLEQAREQITKEHEKSVQLELDIIAKTKQIIEEETRLIELKQRRKAGVSMNPNSYIVNTDGLTPEYIDLLHQKEDTIKHLSCKLSDLEERLTQEMIECKTLFERQANLAVDLHRISCEVHREEARLAPLRMENSYLQNRLSEWDIYIKEAEAAKSRVETALSAATIALDSHELRGGGIVDLEHSVASIRTEIAVIEAELGKQIGHLADENSVYNGEERALAAELATVCSLYDWGNQKTELTNAVAETKRKLEVNRAELVNIEKGVFVRERRMKVLQPLVKKHLKNAATVWVDENETIDELIGELERAGRKATKKAAAHDNSLERVRHQNMELDRLIELRKREVYQLAQVFQGEVSNTKKKITQLREESTVKEVEFVKAIAKLASKGIIRSKWCDQ
jgi:chromosome segregation ATPase